MDRLRRIIIQKSDDGYMFSIKDIGTPYAEAAPVGKVIPNGPADSAGLRPGDGLVAINSNLVKGKSYLDLCNLIKYGRCGGLELTIIESYFVNSFHKLKSKEETDSDNQTSSISSPVIKKKKAYTHERENEVENFSYEEKVLNKSSCQSATDLSSRSNMEFIHSLSSKLRSAAVQPKISYKPAKINNSSITNSNHSGLPSGGPAKSDMNLDMVGSPPLTPTTDNTTSKVTRVAVAAATSTDQSKLIYHYAYKQNNAKKFLSKASVDLQQQKLQQIDALKRERRGSTPAMTESSSITVVKGGRFSQSTMNSSELPRKTSRSAQLSKSSTQTSSPVLQLNRVGGLVRAPLSVDEAIDLDDEEVTDLDLLLNSCDTGTNDVSSATGATTESGRSSCDLDTESSVKSKFRHLHCSPMPYKSPSVTSMTIPSSDISLKMESLKTNQSRNESYERPSVSQISPVSKSLIQDDEDSKLEDMSCLSECDQYGDCSIDSSPTAQADMSSYEAGTKAHPNSRHLKKLKNIFGDNYRGRSKTLDCEHKMKDEEIDESDGPMLVMVKWISYEGKTMKGSWKQYSIQCDEYNLVFNRERSQSYITSSSLDDVNMTLNLLGAFVEEIERRGRKNILKLQSSSQSECYLEFEDKTCANKWLIMLQDKSKPEKDDKAARTASFKERHSLTVPNLYSKESIIAQNQFSKSKSKSKEESVQSSTVGQSCSHSNKGVFHHAMSRVKNLKNMFAANPTSDFERQQEEWFNRSVGGTTSSKLPQSSSYSEEIHSSLESSVSTVLTSVECKQMGSQLLDPNYFTSLPLHKWHRSITSRFVPLAVELCISIIEKFGMNLVGLYRVSGNKIALDSICAELRKPVSEIDSTSDKWNDLHAVCGVLKSFFRNLPDGLFPKDLYSDIIGACRLHEFDRDRRLLSIHRILSIMDIAQDHPEYRYHRETLRYLVEHLSRVASRHQLNKMNARNLAVVFAPTLMKPPQETSQILVNDSNYKIQLIETLIKYHKWLFSSALESSCNIPSDVEDNEMINSDDPSVLSADATELSTAEVTDARPLVREILNAVQDMPQENVDNFICLDDDAPEIEPHLTLDELVKLAYHSMHNDYKEVDIDEECEKRKGNIQSKIESLKVTSESILMDCTKDLNDLKLTNERCQKDLDSVHEKLFKIDDEIAKTQNLIEKSSSSEHVSESKFVASQLFELPGRNLSSFSVTLISKKETPLLIKENFHKDSDL